MAKFSLRAPFVGAAMSGASGAELAAAVARAGGFGFIGAGLQPIMVQLAFVQGLYCEKVSQYVDSKRYLRP